MAGLTGFGLGSAMQGAAGLTGATDAVNAVSTAPVNVTDVGKALADQGSVLGQGSQALNSVGSNLPFPPKVLPESISSLTDVAQQGFQQGASQPIKALGQEGGLKSFGAQALKMKNLVPTATGLGGIAVEQGIEKSNANIQGMKDRKERESKEAIANYVENRPGMTQAPFGSQYTPGMQPQGMSQSGTSMKNPYANRYASGGRVRRFKGAGDVGMPTTYVDENGVTQPIDYSQIGNFPMPNLPGTPNPTPDPTPDPIPKPTPEMPDISQRSLGYDPSSIDMATGLRKTDEQLEGMVRGRGITPVPYNYMAGFMPEYQYVSNIQPTSTSLGATGTGTTGAEGSYNTPFGAINVGGQNVYKGSYDPDLFAGGTPYNEYLLGNEEKGIPDYLSSYMQNTPYYQYQDQELNNIYGGGGYGTPGFDGGQQMMMPQQSGNDQITALNQRIADLMSQINPTPTEEVTEEVTEEGTEEKKKDKNTSPRWERTNSYRNDEGVTVITLIDMNSDSSTFGDNKTELDESTKTKTEAPVTQTVEDFAEGSLEAYGGETGREERQASLDADSYLNSIASNPTAYGYTSFEDAQEKLAGKYGAGNISAGLKKEIYDNATFSYSGDNVSGVEISLGDNNIKDFLPYASGGQIKNSINTLDQYAQPLPMGNMSLNNISLGNMYAEGGMVQDDKVDALMQNPVIQEKMSEGDRGLLQQASFVLLGRIDDDGSIISEFVDKFGSDALDMLKGELLPDMQQQGMIEGQGGGMDDKVDGVIGDQERVAVSPGEYIVPADVVGDLGDGNSEQGARIMDDFLSRVRTEKHGTDQQPSPVNLNNVMPS